MTDRVMTWATRIAGVAALAAGLAVGVPSVALSYEEIAVTNPGTLTGRATLVGAMPDPRIFPMALYPFGPFCDKNPRITDGSGNIRIQEFEIGADNGLKDVVIAVQGVKKGKAFPPIVAEIVARDCEFLPFVSVVQNHGQFHMVNEDPVIHNSQVYQAEKGNLRLTVPNPPNSEGMFPIDFERKYRIFQMICGMHEFMQTWGYAVDNPYYAVTDQDGQFSIEGLPPGTYKVTAWRPHFKPVQRKIKIEANGTARMDVAFDGSTVKRPIYESQERFRIQ